MNVCDIIILIALAFGAVGGFKAGVIKKTADFVGMFIIVILAFYLKNYLSVIMYENLPFFNFWGFIKGLDAINILFYETLAFIIVFMALLTVTGLIEKLLKATIILSIPSKLLGIVVGIIEMYVYVFLILIVLTLPIFDLPYVRESKTANFIINNTPILSGISEDMINIYDDVYDVVINKNSKTDEQLNSDITKILIDNNVITKESARKLVERNKLHINDKTILE